MLNRVFHERMDKMEVEPFDTGVLKKEETTNESGNTSGNGPIRDL